jgi:hypothetical protein
MEESETLFGPSIPKQFYQRSIAVASFLSRQEERTMNLDKVIILNQNTVGEKPKAEPPGNEKDR